MKKEILFKAKRKFYGNWIEGIPTFDMKYLFNSENIDSPDNYEIDPETICQFIGETDKNGVKIYEGDYLVDKYPVYDEDLSEGYYEDLLPVVWCKKQLMWCVDTSYAKDGSYLTSLVEYFGDFLEVKGNMCDHN
jgi:hypothetical protein